jgi:hypothetical protein
MGSTTSSRVDFPSVASPLALTITDLDLTGYPRPADLGGDHACAVARISQLWGQLPVCEAGSAYGL